jgi:hypothetical protein
MNLKRILTAVANVVANEATRNPEFRSRIEEALGQKATERRSLQRLPDEKEKRKGGRRALAVLDPVDLVRHGEVGLRSRLNKLELERLLDIVAQYGMDPGKLVMKWKDRERVIDRIVEVAVSRATKGDAFRSD